MEGGRGLARHRVVDGDPAALGGHLPRRVEAQNAVSYTHLTLPTSDLV